MLKYHGFWIVLLIMSLLFSACSLPQPLPKEVQIVGGNQTWFDAPLNGMIIPPNLPYEIVLHAYSTSKVNQIELKANQTLLVNLPNPSTQNSLVNLKYNWFPTSAGNYTLIARAQDGNGNWGSYATVHITVGDFTPTTVVSLLPSETPTVVISFTPTPVINLSFTRQVSTSIFYYGNCTPNSVTVKANVSDPNSVNSVVLFQKLESQSQIENWDAGTVMNPLGNGAYSITISGDSVPNHTAYTIAHWVFQFVATNKSGQVIERSQSYFDDVDLSACTSQRQIITITPTPAVFIWPPSIRVISPTPTLFQPVIK